MFRELDDPTPPSFDDGMRRKVRGRVRARRQRRLAVGGAAGAVVLATGGLYARAANRLGDVERLEVAGTGAVADGGAITILLLGTDTAPAIDGQEPPLVGQESSPAFADSMMLVRLDGDQVRLLSLPRDLDVGDPGAQPVRLNSVLPTKGPEGLIAVVEQHLGIPVDHLAMVDFDGFRDLVDTVGGIEVAVPAPLRDEQSGLELGSAGCQQLTGAQALALVRARHLEVLVDGVWQADPSGDVGRTVRQRAFLVAALTALQRRSPDPLRVDQLAGWAAEHLTVDSELDRATLTRLLRAGLSTDAAAIRGEAVPTVPVVVDGVAVLQPSDRVDEVLRWFDDGSSIPTRPGGDEPSLSAEAVGIRAC